MIGWDCLTVSQAWLGSTVGLDASKKEIMALNSSKKELFSKKYYPRPNLSAPSGTRTRVESMLRVHAQTWEASIIPLDQWRRGVHIWLKIELI
jgi:hypothetical protein